MMSLADNDLGTFELFVVPEIILDSPSDPLGLAYILDIEAGERLQWTRLLSCICPAWVQFSSISYGSPKHNYGIIPE